MGVWLRPRQPELRIPVTLGASEPAPILPAIFFLNTVQRGATSTVVASVAKGLRIDSVTSRDDTWRVKANRKEEGVLAGGRVGYVIWITTPLELGVKSTLLEIELKGTKGGARKCEVPVIAVVDE